MNESKNPLLQVRNLKKHFYNNASTILKYLGSESDQVIKAVDGVSFNLQENEVLGVVGESGCGKSTLGLSIARLHPITEGEIIFKGEDITTLSKTEMRNLRKDIQVVFQDPTSSLNPRMKINRLIGEPLNNFYDLSRDELNDKIDSLLNDVRLPLEFKDRYPHELSGGQQQRVVIARALATDPDLIIADEPVTGLDVSIQAEIINLLNSIQEKRSLSIIFIAHDLRVIRMIADSLIVLYLGNIVEQGDSEEILSNPQHPYSIELKKGIPDLKTKKENYEPLTGEPPSPANPPDGCPFHTRCPEYIDQRCENEHPSLIELNDNRQISCHHFEEGDPPNILGEPSKKMSSGQNELPSTDSKVENEG